MILGPTQRGAPDLTAVQGLAYDFRFGQHASEKRGLRSPTRPKALARLRLRDRHIDLTSMSRQKRPSQRRLEEEKRELRSLGHSFLHSYAGGVENHGDGRKRHRKRGHQRGRIPGDCDGDRNGVIERRDCKVLFGQAYGHAGSSKELR